MAEVAKNEAERTALWARAVAAPLPRWEEIARVGFAGAYLTYHLTVRFRRDVDWGPVEAALLERYERSDDGLVMHGRRIRLGERRLSLGVWGTASDRPGDDGGLQSALLMWSLEALSDALQAVTTERWTDTPFEEPPARKRTGTEARDFLEALVHQTFCLRVEELDYFSDNPNPEIVLVWDATSERVSGVRQRYLPLERYLRPGRYVLRAEVQPYSMPYYHSDLKDHARAPLWTSAPLAIAGGPGETVRLRVGVPEAQRGLSDDEQRFFLQRRPRDYQPEGARVVPDGEPMDPPPPPRENVTLAIIDEGRRDDDA